MKAAASERAQEVGKRAQRKGRRWWGAGVLAQSWLSAIIAIRENPRGWLQESRDRIGGKILKRWFALPCVPLSSLVGNEPAATSPIMDDICLPPFVVTDTHNDFDVLMRVAAVLRPRLVLELGTAHGNTVANICRACPEARVMTVNAPPEEISGGAITYVLSREEIGRVYRRYGFSDRVMQIFCNTLQLDLSQYLTGATIDLAIVDACHDCKYVMSDFLKVVQYVRRGGIVLLHDTHPSMALHLWSSYTACMKLRRRGFDIRHIENTWWAMWINRPGERRTSGRERAGMAK